MLRVPLAVQQKILALGNYVDVQMMRFTCTHFAEHKHSFDTYLDRFLAARGITFDLHAMLREYGAQLSGSTIYQIMYGVWYKNSDLDIYFTLVSIFNSLYVAQTVEKIKTHIRGAPESKLSTDEMTRSICAHIRTSVENDMVYGFGRNLTEEELLLCQEQTTEKIKEHKSRANVPIIAGAQHYHYNDVDYNFIFVRYPQTGNYIHKVIQDFDFGWLKNSYDGQRLRVLDWPATLATHHRLELPATENSITVAATLSRVAKYTARGFAITASVEFMKYAEQLLSCDHIGAMNCAFCNDLSYYKHDAKAGLQILKS